MTPGIKRKKETFTKNRKRINRRKMHSNVCEGTCVKEMCEGKLVNDSFK